MQFSLLKQHINQFSSEATSCSSSNRLVKTCTFAVELMAVLFKTRMFYVSWQIEKHFMLCQIQVMGNLMIDGKECLYFAVTLNLDLIQY